MFCGKNDYSRSVIMAHIILTGQSITLTGNGLTSPLYVSVIE